VGHGAATLIFFGTAVTDQDAYERIALPGIRRVSEPDSIVRTLHGYDSIQRPYNLLMEEAAAREDLEALVLLHQDFELTDGSLSRRVRPLLADQRNGVVGSFGGREIVPHRWTETTQLHGTAVVPGLQRHFGSGPEEVEVVDGSLLVIAPWVTRAVRFNEALARNFHGYDVDFCFRVRAVGGRVVCDDIPYIHRMSPRDDHDAVRLAGLDLATMWDPALRPREWAPAFQF
jgi:hypothetical protein